MAPDWLRQHPKVNYVILDSSAIFMIFEFSINLEDELTRLLGKYKIIIPKQIFEEIKKLSEFGKGKKKLIAKPALELIKKYEVVDSKGNGDDSVLFLAQKINGIVVTNDSDLKQRVKEKGLKIIYLRNKKKLFMS